MPIYEYQCKTCGITFEKRQSFSDNPTAACPNGHSETQRLLSAPLIVFKGSGFYINDSKSTKNGTADAKASSKKESPKSEKKSTSDSESSSSTKSKNSTSD